MRGRNGLRVVVAALLAVLAGAANAAELQDLAVQTEDQDGQTQYLVSGRLEIERPPGPAFAAATDFDALADAAELIQESRLIAPERLSSTLAMCVAFYCKTVQQVADLSLRPPERLDMQFVPGAGDFKQGQASWRFQPVGHGHTRLDFNAALVPDFWVPPLIGTWAIRRALAGQIIDTARAIEQVADEKARANATTR